MDPLYVGFPGRIFRLQGIRRVAPEIADRGLIGRGESVKDRAADPGESTRTALAMGDSPGSLWPAHGKKDFCPLKERGPGESRDPWQVIPQAIRGQPIYNLSLYKSWIHS